MARDNILLITTDQQRFDTINAWGNQSIFTPHLNYMAAMGISYKNCYAACPICVPSRTTIMTGRQGYESGVVSNATHASFMQACTKDRSTLPAILTDAGYQTAPRAKCILTLPALITALSICVCRWTICANMTKSRTLPAPRYTASENAKWNRPSQRSM